MNEIENGPLVTEAMVCPAKGEPLVLKEIVLPPLTVNQVQVDIDFCGLCHTDIHMKGKAVSEVPGPIFSLYRIPPAFFSRLFRR
jgi:D-arabinose 1-dehydrogenase-like Zn-dependent alcohol dehydrogenase